MYIIFQCEHWSMTLGTAVYSFRTKIKVQICKYVVDVPKSGCLEALKSNLSFLLLQTFHFTKQRSKVTAVFSTKHSQVSRFCFQLQQIMECSCRWNLNTSNIHIHEKQFKNHNLVNAISFVVLHISYGDCSYLNYYK